MRKALFIIATVTVLFLSAGPAAAVPFTWIDTHNPGDFEMNHANKYYSYQHDIKDEGFNPWPEDMVYSYDLTISLHDDDDNKPEWVFINLPGFEADNFVEVNYSNVDLGMSIAGWVQLNLTGTLNVSLTRITGDFWFDRSTLYAHGWESNPAPAPVPEPASMALLGLGLLYLVGFGRKKLFSNKP